ncbi:MAG TPA: Ig-like domain-containing protein, partial [Clostridia bacterium]|nr:Ig-like domain-containing protein [Clostridia bacterium]
VSQSGKVTAIKSGKAKIHVASAEDESKYVECEVTVQEGSSDPGTGTHVTVASINLSPTSITMTPQEEKQLTAEVLPFGANQAVVWSTSDSAIISVSQSGKVTAIKSGKAKIHVASAEDESIFAECEVTVSSDTGTTDPGTTDPGTGTHVTVASINLSPASITMALQEQKQFTAEVLPIDATNKAVVWSTSDSAIISVSQSGKVTAIKSGKAKIHVASAEDESIFAECEVTVTGDPGTTDPGTTDPGTTDPGTNVPQNASINMQKADYKNADISVTITFNGHNLNQIMNGDKQLIKDQDYTISNIVYAQDNKTMVSADCIIKNSYIATLPKEQTTNLTFDFGSGTDTQLSISVPKIDECFIATAAFGSKFQPAVAMLRQFRDKCLLTNWLGTQFVKFYYKNSPPIAHFIAGNDTLRGIVRGMLVPFIAIAYGILHPVVGCLELIVVIFATVLWRKRRRKLINL